VGIIRVESSIVVNRRPDEVFACATDPANAPEWQSSALEASVDGPVQVGASGREMRKFLGRRIESTIRIEAYEPPRRFAIQVTSGPVPFHIEQTVEPEGAGSRVSVVMEGEPGGFFKLAEPLVERAVRRELEGNFATLKDILERRG
jgi:carbon monoxide dehydrogenase subunit G